MLNAKDILKNDALASRFRAYWLDPEMQQVTNQILADLAKQHASDPAIGQMLTGIIRFISYAELLAIGIGPKDSVQLTQNLGGSYE